MPDANTRQKDVFHPLRIEGGSTDDLRGQLNKLAEVLGRLVERLQVMSDPDQRVIVLANLSLRSAIEAARVAAAIEGTVDQIAWPTRNLFEINLRIRHLLADPQNVTRFRQEMVSDQIKLLEAQATLLEEQAVEAKKAIQERIDVARQQLEKEGMEVVPQITAWQLAEKVGAKAEYDGFYKLYSKYVHPSAFLVMSGQPSFEPFDRYSRRVLTLNAQHYAHDTLKRVAEATGTDIETLNAGTS